MRYTGTIAETYAEEVRRPCGQCGAKPMEKCRTKTGYLAEGFSHAQR